MRNPAKAYDVALRSAFPRSMADSCGFLPTNRSFLRGSVRLRLWQHVATGGFGKTSRADLATSVYGWLSGGKVRTGAFLKSKNTSTQKGDQYSVRPLVDRPAKPAKQELGSLLGLVAASG